MLQRIGVLIAIVGFVMSANLASATSVPVNTNADAPAVTPLRQAVAEIANSIVQIVTAIDAVVGRLTGAIADHFAGVASSGKSPSFTASVATAGVPSTVAATSISSTPTSLPPTATTTEVVVEREQPIVEAVPSDDTVTQGELADLLSGMKSALSIIAGQRNGIPAAVETQIAALQSAIPSQGYYSYYRSTADVPLGGGPINTITAANAINQLSRVTITNSTIDSASIPDLSAKYLSLGGGTLTGALTSSSTATTTFAAGFNILSGCFSVNGVCITGGGGGSGTVGSGTQGQFAFYNAAGTALTATSSIFLAPSGNVGIGTTTPWARLSISGPDTSSTTPAFVVADSNSNPALSVFDDGSVIIGNSNASSVVTINANQNGALRLSDPVLDDPLRQDGGSDLPLFYSTMAEYQTGSGGLYTYTHADATNKVISGVTFDIAMYSTSSLPMDENQAFLINCYRPGDDALWPVEQQYTSWNQNQGGGTNYCLDGETIFAVGNDYTPNGPGDISATPLTVVSAANGNHDGFPTGGGRVLINRNTPSGASSTLDILQIYPDRPGIRYEEAPSQTADPFSIIANDNSTVLADIKSSGGGYFGGNVGIGTTTPQARLEVWGPDSAASTTAFLVANNASTTELAVLDNGNATLAGNLIQSSDQRLKTNLQDLDGSSSLAEIEALNPVTFHWIDPAKSSVPQFGFIAQQVQHVFPDLVSTTSPTALTPDGTLSLNYIDLISPIVAAIQELDREIASLASTVAGFAQSFASHVLVGDNVTANNELCVGSTCVTPAQFQAMVAAANQSAGALTSSSPSTPTATDTPPVIAISGDNPAIVDVGASYSDLGATIIGPQADLNLGIKTFLNGAFVSNIVLDTSAVATDTIDYVVTDRRGLTSTSTRIIVVGPAPAPPSSASSATTSSTEATSSDQ
ncbi:MAG: tail fiber domain-containing protein [Roseiarcus sp.]|jgi:hypothetical protein